MDPIKAENEQLKQQLQEQRKEYFQLNKDYLFACKNIQIQNQTLEELQKKYESLSKAYHEPRHAS